jgi:protein kinase A
VSFGLPSSIVLSADNRVSFEQYPEDNVAAQYGQPGPDPFGSAFPDFDYAGDMS